jgi:serine/threonine protein kinase
MCYELANLSAEIPDGVISLHDFDLDRELGAGGFGKVLHGWHRATRTEVAVKLLFTDEGLQEDLITSFVHEVKMLWKCRAPFVLSLMAFSVRPPLAIVMPYLNKGSLFDYTRPVGEKARLDNTQKSLVAIGVAYGMSRLHKANVVHRDLKSPNILLDSRLLPFICDFGIAKSVEGKNVMMTQLCGSTYWMAPEQIATDCYDCKVDVYSYGVVLYEMLCESIPFLGMQPVEVALLVVGGVRPDLPRKHLKVCRLIEQCWAQDPRARPSFEQIYNEMTHGNYLWDGTNAKAVVAIQKLINDSAHKINKRPEPAKKEHHKEPKKESREHRESAPSRHRGRTPSPRRSHHADDKGRHGKGKK